MPTCEACSSLPMRDILRYFDGDTSNGLLSTLLFWKDSYEEPERISPCLKLHNTLRELEACASNCSLCDLVCKGLHRSLRYHDASKSNAQSAIWLRLRQTSLHVYLGNDVEPESAVGGVIAPSVARDDPISQHFKTFTVISNPLHPVVLETIEHWLQVCTEQHEDCLLQGRSDPILPTRLLDLHSLPTRQDLIGRSTDWRSLFENGSLKLVETSPGDTGRYISLSYCWGRYLAFKTTSKNLQKHKQDGGISFTQLPMTLQDALFLVRYLGFRYLWADCLCIIQDDKADWEREAARMADVYSNSFVTVAAMRASHCGEGFLQARTPRQHLQQATFSDSEGSFTLDFQYHDHTESPGSLESAIAINPLKLQREDPMMDRVWCFQERVLAPRTLHFTRHQLYWECETGLFEETVRQQSNLNKYTEYSIPSIARGLNSLKHRDRKEAPPASRREQLAWSDVVLEYSSRNITYQSDKLPALSGIVASLQQATDDICYAGIWRSWFVEGLLWRTQDPTADLYVYAPKQPQRPTEWRAPSWSFAAIEGVTHYDMLSRGGQLCADFEDCSVVPKGHNPLGELQSGFARIKAPQVTLYNISRDITMNGREAKVRLRDETEREVVVYFDVEYHEACTILMITTSLGVVIVPDGSDKQCFVRVGMAEVHRKWDKLSRQFDIPDWPEPCSVTLL